MWFLGNKWQEMTKLYVIPILLIFQLNLGRAIELNTYLIFFVLIGIDSSHCYSTFFRTLSSSQQRERFKKLHTTIPLFIISAVFLWCFLGVPFFWTFFLYSTFFHYLFQFYRYHQLTLAINPGASSYSFELVAIGFLSFLSYHFRIDSGYDGFFFKDDLFFFPSKTLYIILLSLISIIILRSMIRIYNDLKNSRLNIGSLTSYIFPIIVILYCFNFANEFYKSFIPLIALHGLTYYHMISAAQAKVQNGLWKSKQTLMLLIILSVSMTFGLLEYFFTINLVDVFKSEEYAGLLLPSLATVAVTLPTFYHYIADLALWNPRDPDYSKLIGRH